MRNGRLASTVTRLITNMTSSPAPAQRSPPRVLRGSSIIWEATSVPRGAVWKREGAQTSSPRARLLRAPSFKLEYAPSAYARRSRL